MLITLNEPQGMLLAAHTLSNRCETDGTPADGALFAFTPNVIVIFQTILFYKHILPVRR